MTSPATKLKRRKQESHSRLPPGAQFLLTAIISAIVGAICIEWFAQLLPGPHVEVSLEALKPPGGSGAGCIFYQFTLFNDKPVDFAYLKIQVPNTISGYKIGFMEEVHSPTIVGPAAVQYFAMGRNARDECDITRSAVNNTIDIQSALSGNMIQVHVSRLSRDSSIMGALATPDHGSSANPTGKYFEGTYEYTVLGQRVSRPVKFSDLGVVVGQ